MTSPANPIDVPFERVTRAEELSDGAVVKAQVCVIGTGAGGAVAGFELAKAGFDVLYLEEGQYLTAKDYGRLSTLRSIKATYRDAGFTFTMGSPNILIPFGRCVGGSTVINSGSAFRMMEQTFVESWKGRHALPGLEWPELVRHFDQVERVMRISPTPEELLGGNGRILRAGAEALGLTGEVVTRNAHGCLGRGRCYLGCPENAKQATHLNYVPEALRAGARLMTGAKAVAVTRDGARITGVDVRAAGGKKARIRIEAGQVVVACGAVHSPVLLEASGLAKGNAHAGRHLRIHPASRVIGLFDTEVKGHVGVPQSYHVIGLYNQGIVPEGVFVPPSLIAPAMPGLGREHTELMRQYTHAALIGYRVVDTGEGRVAGTVMGIPKMMYDLSPRDTERLVESMKLSGEMLFAAGAKRLYLPVFGRNKADSVDELRRLLSAPVPATDIEMSAYHPHGTLRMGADASVSVTRTDGAVHGLEGLRVADASLFPESTVVNPQISVMAIARHVAQRMTEALRG